jgi:hypothetical protein
MSQLDEDVESAIRQFDEQEELEQKQREARLDELVERYVRNTVNRKPAGVDRERASVSLRNLEYDESFDDWSDPKEKNFRVHTHIGKLRRLAKEDDKLLEDCFNGALESLCPIPLKQRKRFRWKVRIAKSKHSGETTLFFRWGIRTKVTFEVKVARVRRIDKPTQPQLEVFEGDAV